MSFWGEAMSHKQGLWEMESYNKGKHVISQLDKINPTITERESLYLDAVRALYGPGTVEERNQLFADLMAIVKFIYLLNF